MTAADLRGPLAVDRHARLLHELREHGPQRLSDLSDRLGVAVVTVRRDVTHLAGLGQVVRVHGGAMLASDAAGPRAAGAPDGTAPVRVRARPPVRVPVDGPAPPVPEEEDGPAHDGRCASWWRPQAAVGLLVPSFDYYWPAVVRGARRAAAGHRLRIALRGSHYGDDDLADQVRRFDADPTVVALVLVPDPGTTATTAALERLVADGRPVVLVEREARIGDQASPVESVVTDHAGGAGAAVRHLAGLGHRTVALVTDRTTPTTPHLHRGWARAAAELGLPHDDGLVHQVAPADLAAPSTWTTTVLQACRDRGVTAVLAHADAQAVALAQAAEAHGLAVPGDLSVVAYDDEVAELFSPSLTAVRTPRESLGAAAVDLVVARLGSPARPVHRVVLSPGLQVRASTAPPAVAVTTRQGARPVRSTRAAARPAATRPGP